MNALAIVLILFLIGYRLSDFLVYCFKIRRAKNGFGNGMSDQNRA